MPSPPVALPHDLTTLPFRIATPVVLAICGYGRVTLTSRIKAGKMPKPIDRGGAGDIWLRDDILRALKLIPDPNAAPEPSGWENFDPVAFKALLEQDKADRAFARKMDRMEAKRLAPPPPKPKVIDAKLPPLRGRAAAPATTEPDVDRPRLRSIMKQLGPYVVIKPRKDGTYYVYQFVPLIHRPKGWRATIPLPLDEPRTGNLRDRTEFKRIQVDAAALHRTMMKERVAEARQGGRPVGRKPKAKGPDA